MLASRSSSPILAAMHSSAAGLTNIGQSHWMRRSPLAALKIAKTLEGGPALRLGGLQIEAVSGLAGDVAFRRPCMTSALGQKQTFAASIAMSALCH
jgi:hypothetical protein